MFWNPKKKITLCCVVGLGLVFFSLTSSAAQQLLESKLEDGVLIRVSCPQGTAAVDPSYLQEVLDTASQAYQEIVLRQEFNRQGYTFAASSRLFAYDSDRAIDIYITAEVDSPYALCQPQGGLEYKASIFLPADYQRYRKEYNITQPHLELKASLIHELLHIVTYSYNRNLQGGSQAKASVTSERWDWYTEGLARYFEALAGYREEFLSCGFRKSSGDKIIVYKGGVNYFLQYPNRSLDERKYDYALFWQYIHQTYGMAKIEEISASLRKIDPQFCSNQEAMQLIAETLGVSIELLMQDFSLYIYEASSVPAKKEAGFNPVSTIKLLAGRNQTVAANISSFGFDFYEMDLKEAPAALMLKSPSGQGELSCVIGVLSSSDFSAFPAETDYTSGKIKIETKDFPSDSRMIIMLSNPTSQTVSYQLCLTK